MDMEIDNIIANLSLADIFKKKKKRYTYETRPST